MALANGTKLGPYEIVAPLGAGGMGEVYRARDTRLDRAVAIKVLPPHLSEKTEARQRLEREARAISALSHPHICALYDIGQQGGIDFLVMEYLEGETLAQRLSKGGPLWQHPFWERFVRHAKEFNDRLTSMHLNPVRKGGVKRPEDWRWSSHNNFALDRAIVRERPMQIDYVRLPEEYRGGRDTQCPRSEKTLTVAIRF